MGFRLEGTCTEPDGARVIEGFEVEGSSSCLRSLGSQLPPAGVAQGMLWYMICCVGHQSLIAITLCWLTFPGLVQVLCTQCRASACRPAPLR